jgi:hypothetical protein
VSAGSWASTKGALGPGTIDQSFVRNVIGRPYHAAVEDHGSSGLFRAHTLFSGHLSAR